MTAIHTSHKSDLPTHRHTSGSRCRAARIVSPVDLSAVIFVVLALAWAAYLIPKALQHHDEVASDRLVEGHTDKVRILSRRRRGQAEPEVVEVEVEHVETVETISVAATEELTPAPRPLPTLAAARRAAQRRRRVLSVLLVVLACVIGLASFVVIPWWSVAIPAGLVVAFLVTARLAVRRTSARRVPVVERRERAVVEEGRGTRPETTTPASQDLVDLLTDQDVSAAVRRQAEEAMVDEGSLWDPLPLTLPTYVNKARARRTVRTIELTGINSSGHNDADSTLARDAEESAATKVATEAEARRVAEA